ncbi:MAG TPA: hypothetical protein VHC94_01730 [Nitrobacter sp.]|nr:hypothetical protein [Nitrobacter sp.]
MFISMFKRCTSHRLAKKHGQHPAHIDVTEITRTISAADEFYSETIITPPKGERWFCSENAALAAGVSLANGKPRRGGFSLYLSGWSGMT